MPAPQGLRRDQTGKTIPRGPEPPEHREDHPFFGPESGPGNLSAQDVDLLAHDQEFEILVTRRATSKEKQAQYLAQADGNETEEHGTFWPNGRGSGRVRKTSRLEGRLCCGTLHVQPL